MKCNEFMDCVCEIIDKRLSEDRTKELMEHARMCPHCTYEYESLRTAKMVVQSKIHRSSVPSEVYYSIVNALAAVPRRFRWREFLLSRRNPIAAVLGLAVVALAVYTLIVPQGSVPDDANIITQSVNNYQAMIGGALKPQLVSDHDDVQSFLEKETGFDVNIPKMKGCSTCGGRLSKFKGVTLAHVVFNVDGGMVYIYQADWAEAMKGDKIALPEEARNELERSQWYIRELPKHETVVLWRYKNTLCAAVSNLAKDRVLALLTDNN